MRTNIAALAFGLVTLAPVASSADSSLTLQITAHVDVFCRISAPDDAPIGLVNGNAQIGAIQEICNTPTGYDVTTRFTNLDGGDLNVAGQDYAIDNSGSSVRHMTGPHVLTQEWQLADAKIVQPQSAVLMQVTITPL